MSVEGAVCSGAMDSVTGRILSTPGATQKPRVCVAPLAAQAMLWRAGEHTGAKLDVVHKDTARFPPHSKQWGIHRRCKGGVRA